MTLVRLAARNHIQDGCQSIKEDCSESRRLIVFVGGASKSFLICIQKLSKSFGPDAHAAFVLVYFEVIRPNDLVIDELQYDPVNDDMPEFLHPVARQRRPIII